MQFRDLKKQYQVLKEEMDVAISEVLENCNFISGNQVKELEERLAKYVGRKHCITCGNGTDALTMMMMAWNIREGDAVLFQISLFASAEVVSFEGATPVFYDVDPDSFNADVTSLKDAIQKVKDEGKLIPRAIIAVDLLDSRQIMKNLKQLQKKTIFFCWRMLRRDLAEESVIERHVVSVMHLQHHFPGKTIRLLW